MSAGVDSMANGLSQLERRPQRALGGVVRVHLAERDAGEQQQRPDLDQDQHVLQVRRELGADDADERHQPR